MIRNLTQNTVIAASPEFACTFRQRLFGLIGRKFSPSFDGLIFSSCNAIHTLFMGFPIDVIFADREKRVLKKVDSFPSYRLYEGSLKAYWTIELPSGTLRASNTQTGDLLDF